MSKRMFALVFSLAVAGCGGTQKAAPPVAEAPPPNAEKAVADFHDVLAPLWHADPSPQRTEDTCAKAPEMVALAETVNKAAQPAWAEQAAGLVSSSQALAADCQAGRAGFEAKFHDVHEAFHRVAESAGAGHH
jgi:hypothetical protein